MFNSWYFVAGFIYDDFYRYLMIIGILAAVYQLIFKKICTDIFDPVFVMLLTMLFADSIVFLMYINDLFVDNMLFYQSVISELCLLMGLCMFKKHDVAVECFKWDMEKIKNDLYVIYGVLFCLLTVVFYSFYGIPVLSGNNHLVATMGAGMVIRPLSAIKMIFCVLWLDRFLRKKYFDTIPLGIFLMASFLLNGSKGEVVTLAFAIYFLKLIYEKYEAEAFPAYRKLKRVLILVVLSLILVSTYITTFSGDADFLSVVTIMLFRLSVSGDIFGYAYASDIGEILYNNYNYIDFIIYPILNVLHVIPSDEVIPGIGYQISQLVNNNVLVESGPNARHNVMGWIAFGYFGSFIYSFLVGVVISFVCRRVMFGGVCHPCVFYILIGLYGAIVALPTEFMLGFCWSIDVLIVNGIIMYIYRNIRGAGEITK